jgi:hypothetical protein
MGTKKCNKDCYYCTTNNNTDNIEVDIDFLNYVLDTCPDDLAVELTGGEIGLISNIDDFYYNVRKHPHVNYIKALSNGLLRKKVDWIDELDEYWEHLIYEIKGKEIIRFYTDLGLQEDHTYVIVTTESTTRSLLANWKYFRELGMFRDNFFYKLMNHKTIINFENNTIQSYWNDLFELYKRLDNEYFLKMLIHYLEPQRHMVNEKILCQRFPPNIYVDLQTRELGHCAMNVKMSLKDEFNKENLEKVMDGVNENNYCARCYSFDNGKNRSKFRNRSYEQ